MDLAAGTRLGPYEIHSQLGLGGMGVVYRARDTRLGRDVAIKLLPPFFAEDEDRLRRFEQEARVTGALNHPNIVGVFDVGNYEGSPYVVMELLEGGTLRQKLTGKPFPVRRAVDIARGIAEGLAAAHEKGIIHRDLKPENVFITKDGRVKVLDFGLATTRRTAGPGVPGITAPVSPVETESGTVLGTVGYMSPEQVRGERVDVRSDLFSLGIILWEMLAGKRPFHGPSAVETMNSILKDEPSQIDAELKLPPVLERILHTCLAKDPSGRFHSAHDLAFALETTSTDPSSGRKATFDAVHPGKGRFWNWVLAVCSALVIGILGWFGGRWTHPAPPLPEYNQVTFRQGGIVNARFTPDGREVLYTAAWENEPLQTYAVSLQTLETQPVGPSGACLLNLTANREVLLSLNQRHRPDLPTMVTSAGGYTGVLATAPYVGKLVAKERLAGVLAADIAPDGTLAIVREQKGQSLLECPPGTVRAQTPGNFGPLRFSPTGNKLAFLEHRIECRLGSKVGLLDMKSGGVTFLTPDWPDVGGLAWKGDELWCDIGGSLVALQGDGGYREALRIPGGIVLHDFLPDGTALVSRHDWRFAVFSYPGKGESATPLSRGAWPFLCDLAADGRALFIEEGGVVNGGVYFCSRDGSLPTRIDTAGEAASISPDLRWVVTESLKPVSHVVLTPIGPGERKDLPGGGLEGVIGLGWAGNGKILISANEKGKGKRIFIQESDGGMIKPLTEEGIYFDFFLPPKTSPDGTRFLARTKDGCVIVPLGEGSGEPKLIKGVEVGEKVVGWCVDSRHVFIVRWGPFPISVWTLDPETGKREIALPIDPKDYHGPPAANIFLRPDGKAGAFLTSFWHSELYVVTGLR